MEAEKLKSLLTPETFEDLKKEITGTKPQDEDLQDLINQYDIDNHVVMDAVKRRDKTVTLDDAGSTKLEYVARLPLPIQKKIVSLAAAFLCGNPIELHATPENDTEKNLLEVLKKTWEDNKLDYESKSLAKLMMAYTEVAELWYTEPASPTYWKGTPNDTSSVKYRLRMKVLSPKYGDKLYPVFSETGDMIAFGREYSVGSENRFDVYTETMTLKGVKGANGWVATPEENTTGKIPVIYYNQDQPEWADVQPLIDRLEKSYSNHADTNDYFGSPMIITKGNITGFATKGETGKNLQVNGEGDVKTLSWDQSPESVKLEQVNLSSAIYNLTSTPDISFEQMKSIGAMSGVAIKLMFLDAHLKASDKEENFGKSVQRRINFLLSALAKINVSLEKGLTLSVRPRFEYYLPKNDKETMDVLTEAVTGKILSQKTAVNLNPLVEDKESEIKNLKDEANSAGALADVMNTQL